MLPVIKLSIKFKCISLLCTNFYALVASFPTVVCTSTTWTSTKNPQTVFVVCLHVDFSFRTKKKRTILWYNNNESNCYVGNLWSSKKTTLDECWGWFVGGVVENFLMTYNKLKTERRKMFVRPSKKNSIRCQNDSDEIDSWWSQSNLLRACCQLQFIFEFFLFNSMIVTISLGFQSSSN